MREYNSLAQIRRWRGRRWLIWFMCYSLILPGCQGCRKKVEIAPVEPTVKFDLQDFLGKRKEWNDEFERKRKKHVATTGDEVPEQNSYVQPPTDDLIPLDKVPPPVVDETKVAKVSSYEAFRARFEKESGKPWDDFKVSVDEAIKAQSLVQEIERPPSPQKLLSLLELTKKDAGWSAVQKSDIEDAQKKTGSFDEVAREYLAKHQVLAQHWKPLLGEVAEFIEGIDGLRDEQLPKDQVKQKVDKIFAKDGPFVRATLRMASFSHDSVSEEVHRLAEQHGKLEGLFKEAELALRLVEEHRFSEPLNKEIASYLDDALKWKEDVKKKSKDFWEKSGDVLSDWDKVTAIVALSFINPLFGLAAFLVMVLGGGGGEGPGSGGDGEEGGDGNRNSDSDKDSESPRSGQSGGESDPSASTDQQPDPLTAIPEGAQPVEIDKNEEGDWNLIVFDDGNWRVHRVRHKDAEAEDFTELKIPIGDSRFAVLTRPAHPISVESVSNTAEGAFGNGFPWSISFSGFTHTDELIVAWQQDAEKPEILVIGDPTIVIPNDPDTTVIPVVGDVKGDTLFLVTSDSDHWILEAVFGALADTKLKVSIALTDTEMHAITKAHEDVNAVLEISSIVPDQKDGKAVFPLKVTFLGFADDQARVVTWTNGTAYSGR
ncbi:hypothetical protein SH528x_002160 [Novipirellula sp. SH528]|uniref:hypothetical protein n=1 Tax=Novipirellula sp. SH528 TaxID=3454466 RepID=UPI003F9EE28F